MEYDRMKVVDADKYLNKCNLSKEICMQAGELKGFRAKWIPIKCVEIIEEVSESKEETEQQE